MLFTLFFGLNYDNAVYPRPDTEGGHLYLGARSLLRWFETHLGLSGHTERIEHLRVEQYRQALRRYLAEHPTVFYLKSFEADQLACAEALLKRRDELLLSGFDFAKNEGLPFRLKVLVDIENQFLKNEHGASKLIAGEADRFEKVLKALETRKVPIAEFVVNEMIEKRDGVTHLLPPQYLRLFEALEWQNVAIVPLSQKSKKNKTAASDLLTFKNFIQNKTERGKKQTLHGDGSLIIIESDRDTEGADFLAKILSLNPKFRPTFLIPDRNRTLDEALIQNGLPAFGLPSASLGRPTLQLLKLVTAFLWKPLDLHKILEFVTMPVKPLYHDLSVLIAEMIAQRPGIGSEYWLKKVDEFFADLAITAQSNTDISVAKIRNEYNFWFDHKTYDIAQSAPKDEIISLFSYLKSWASEEYETVSKKSSSLLTLSKQAQRIEDFLYELPVSESRLSFLELERIIRTIYEPSPVSPREQELGHYRHVSNGDCLLHPVNKLIWWNFTDTEGVHFFSRWYADEILYLRNQSVILQSPQDENALMLWQRIQAVLRTDRQLILVYPKKVNGEHAPEHPLFSHLRACFGELELITVKSSAELNEDSSEYKKLSKLIDIETPINVPLKPHRLGKIQPIISVHSRLLIQREHETLTSLESLFYYPHQWVFRYKAKLNKSPILSIAKENTLKGNLSHRFFEMILQENFTAWTFEDVKKWVDDNSAKMFKREAATLLMYGFEPEKLQLIWKIKYAIWTLINHIRSNRWQVEGTETDLSGKFGNTPVRGKADLVLVRSRPDSSGSGGERCVLDLKWSGHSYRERMIKNGEDLQLIMYSKLLTDDADWAHTGYFIIENARLLARNTAAFSEIKPLAAADDAFAINQSIWQKMIATYNWRLKQVIEGHIEIRTTKTVRDLEERYGMELLDVLEMKNEEAKYDDYRTLIGLVK